jgi:hypothetical protein
MVKTPGLWHLGFVMLTLAALITIPPAAPTVALFSAGWATILFLVFLLDGNHTGTPPSQTQ